VLITSIVPEQQRLIATGEHAVAQLGDELRVLSGINRGGQGTGIAIDRGLERERLSSGTCGDQLRFGASNSLDQLGFTRLSRFAEPETGFALAIGAGLNGRPEEMCLGW